MERGTSAPTDKEVLEEIVERIVEVANPEKIILFGSSSRGDSNSRSDFDLLVVKNTARRRTLAQDIYVALIGVAKAVDIVVATPDDIERYKYSPSLVVATALQEGKTIYAS